MEQDRARRWVKKGLDPIVEKRRRSPSRPHTNTFETVAQGGSSAMLTGANYYTNQVTSYLERMFPQLARVADQLASGLHICRPIIKDVAARGAKTVAILIRQWCGQNLQLCSCPRSLQLRSLPPAQGTGPSAPRVRHNPPLTWAEIPDFLNRVDNEGVTRRQSSPSS